VHAFSTILCFRLQELPSATHLIIQAIWDSGLAGTLRAVEWDFALSSCDAPLRCNGQNALGRFRGWSSWNLQTDCYERACLLEGLGEH